MVSELRFAEKLIRVGLEFCGVVEGVLGWNEAGSQVIDGLVDQVSPAGRCDFAVDICEPYPIPIICELLGAPKKDWQLFSRWADDVSICDREASVAS